MSDEEKSRSWWQTLPGVITSLTAAVTAVAGLIVAVKQAGWIGTPAPPAVQVSAPAAGSSSSTTTSPSAPATTVAASPPASSAARAVELPALRDYTLGPGSGNVTFTLLQAEVSAQTTEKAALTIRLRMMNNGNYDTNFWDRSFRWIVGGVPTAPDSDLNELVAARSAKEGSVKFVIPIGTTDGKLEISYGDGRTEIPLTLGAPR